MIDALAEAPVTPKRSPVAATLGILSVALLAASFVWAHHWCARADTFVVAWVVATVWSLIFSIQVLWSYDLWPTLLAKRLARICLIGGLISVGVLGLAGILYAVGINPTGVCGGG